MSIMSDQLPAHGKIPDRRKNMLFLAVVLLAALLLRIPYLPHEARDYRVFLKPWYEKILELRVQGIDPLSVQVGNYNLLYQTCIVLMTYLPFSPLTAYKLLSIVFDYGLAFACGRLAVDAVYGQKMNIDQQGHDNVPAGTGRASAAENGKTGRSAAGMLRGSCLSYPLFTVVTAVVLFLPTVFWNSAAWAQCDSIFTCFAVLALAELYEDHPGRAFASLGFSFAWKLQAVFILPFFCMAWLLGAVRKRTAGTRITNLHRAEQEGGVKAVGGTQAGGGTCTEEIRTVLGTKPFSILWFLWIPAMQYIVAVPGFLSGRSLLDPVRIYTEQTDTYHYMYLNFQSVWKLFTGPKDYDPWHLIAELVTVLLLLVILAGLLMKEMSTRKSGKYTEGSDAVGCGEHHASGCGGTSGTDTGKTSQEQLFLPAAAVTSLTMVYFLPAMHERYGYLPDLLLVLWAATAVWKAKSRNRFTAIFPCILAAAAVTASTRHYVYYLWTMTFAPGEETFLAGLCLAVWTAALVILFLPSKS